MSSPNVLDDATPSDKFAGAISSPGWTARGLAWLQSAVALTVAAQLGIFGLQAIHSVILARILGPQGRGEYSTVVMFSQTLLYAGMLGGTFAIARRAGRTQGNATPLANAARVRQ